MKEQCVPLNYRYVANNPVVIERRGILEENSILAIDEEAGNVKGSEVDIGATVGVEVPSPSEMVQPCRDIHNELAVNEDLELAHSVVKVIKVETVEGQQHWTAARGSDVHREAARARSMT